MVCYTRYREGKGICKFCIGAMRYLPTYVTTYLGTLAPVWVGGTDGIGARGVAIVCGTVLALKEKKHETSFR